MQRQDMRLHGCGEVGLVKKWYTELAPQVREIVDGCIFKQLLENITMREVENGLIQSMAERWWDTTHTFHFGDIREITMTPTDFAAIAGLPVHGNSIRQNNGRCFTNQWLKKVLGEPIVLLGTMKIQVSWLYDVYGKIECQFLSHIKIIVRAFILAIVRGVIFSNKESTIDLNYLKYIVDFKSINN